MKKNNLAIILLLLPLAIFSQNSWTKKASLSASKRMRSVAFAIGGRGYLCCGEDSNSIELNDCWEYDPGSDSWMQKSSIPGPGRRDAVGFAIGMKGYVGTGMDNTDASVGNTLSDFYEYNSVTNAWTARAAYPGGFGWGVYSAAGFATSTRGYICCGKIGPANYANDLWEYNPSNNSWIQKPNFPGGPRLGQMSFVIGTKAYVACGTDPNWFTHDFWEYNTSSNSWSQKADFPGSDRAFGSAFALGQKGYMGMGEDGGYSADWFEYDVASNSWNVIAAFGSEGRRSAPTFVIAGAAYVTTGKGVSGKHRDTWQYQPYVTGINENSIGEMSVYPNPASDVLKFDLDPQFVSQHDQLFIQLISIDGKIISKETVNGNSHIELQNQNWPAGTYLYSLTDGNKNFSSGKVIIY
ncbi:MAG: T9SS type A sorting domain-containing protein [Bacteroidetes bacterium]|nr:T9SS type A sorting domain-containing protein [Bacteroidota bacterium]